MAAPIDTTCWHLYSMSISIKQALSGPYKSVEDPTLRLRDLSDLVGCKHKATVFFAILVTVTQQVIDCTQEPSAKDYWCIMDSSHKH